MARSALGLLVAVLGACAADVDYGGTSYQCAEGDCPGGFLCVEERCVADLAPHPPVDIPEITFAMGCDPDDGLVCEVDATPAHEVTVSPFRLDPTEVTQLDYWRCVDGGACATPPVFSPGELPLVPVTRLTWDQALHYCEWAGKRLPTEAEWEAAARGASSNLYSWGNAAPNCGLSHHQGCPPEAPIDATSPEGDRSPFGLAGMGGNVAEWVADWYAEDTYASSAARDPIGPAGGEERVVRGGAFNDSPEDLPAFVRQSDTPDEADEDTGVRCAGDPG